MCTSPPYFGLRDYGVEGQYGLEASPAEYVETIRAVFAEVRRVLADDGVLWLNLGDSYSGGNRGVYDSPGHLTGGVPLARPINPAPAKNLLGVPWRVAFALQDDGWTLRNEIIWHKPNGMPSSVTDRFANRHESVFLFSKSRRYWFDLAAVKVPSTGRKAGNTPESRVRYGAATGTDNGFRAHSGSNPGSTLLDVHETRNPGDVWTFPPSPFPEAHFAVMPFELARRCVAAGCKPDGTVLDPFSGSGTTGAAAAALGRRYVGIDLNAEYLDLSLRSRLAQSALLEAPGAVL